MWRILYTDIYKEEKQHNSSVVRTASWKIKEKLIPISETLEIKYREEVLEKLLEKDPNLYFG